MFVCSKNRCIFVVLTFTIRCHGTESRCIFYAHIASIGGVSPRAPPVIGRAHLIKDVSSGLEKRRLFLFLKKNANIYENQQHPAARHVRRFDRRERRQDVHLSLRHGRRLFHQIRIPKVRDIQEPRRIHAQCVGRVELPERPVFARQGSSRIHSRIYQKRSRVTRVQMVGNDREQRGLSIPYGRTHGRAVRMFFGDLQGKKIV